MSERRQQAWDEAQRRYATRDRQAGFVSGAAWADDNPQPRNKVTQSASGHLVDTPGPCTACDRDWPCPTAQAVAALRSVLDMHVKVVTDRHVAGPTAVCEPCSEDRMFAVWPCPTVAAITEALGEE